MSAELPPTPPLRERALDAARAVAIGRLFAEGLNFVASVVLARLLVPADFGYVAVALLFYSLAIGLLGSSFGSPLIRSKEIDDASIEASMFLSIAFGACLCALTIGVGFAIQGPIGHPQGRLLMLMAPCFLVVSIGVVPQALRSRNLQFGIITVFEVLSSAIGSIVMVALALVGAGAASIVLGYVLQSAINAGLSFYRAGARWPRWHRAEAIAITRYGLPASLSTLVSTLGRNVDYAVLSARQPAAVVGFYYRAYQLSVEYQGKITTVVLRVLFPVLARAHEGGGFAEARSRIVSLHTTVLFPLLTIILSTAPQLIPWLYGPQWHAAVVPAQILVVAGAVTTIGTGIGPVAMAAGHPRALLVNNCISLAFFAALLLSIGSLDIVAICVAISIYRVFALSISQYLLGERVLGIPVMDTVIKDPGPAFLACIPHGLVTLGVVSGLDATGLPEPVPILLASITGLSTYALAIRRFSPKRWSDLTLIFGRFVPKRRRTNMAPVG